MHFNSRNEEKALASKTFYQLLYCTSPVKPLYLYDALQHFLARGVIEIRPLERAVHDLVADIGEETRLHTHVQFRVCKFIRGEIRLRPFLVLVSIVLSRLRTRVAINDPGYFAPPPNQDWLRFRSRGRRGLHLEVRKPPSARGVHTVDRGSAREKRKSVKG